MLARLTRVILASALVAWFGASGLAQPLRVRLVELNVRLGIDPPGSTPAVATGKFLTNQALPGAPAGTSGLKPDVVCLHEMTNDSDNLAFRDQYLPGYQYIRVNQVDAGGNFAVMLVRPDYQVLNRQERYIGGPRNMLRVTMRVPGADRLLTVYTAHFKAFGDASSTSQRRTNANSSGIFISEDIALGLDLDGDGVRETPMGYVLLCGDLNSSNNGDGSLNGLFTNASTGQPTGLLNLPVESLLGRILSGDPIITTFPPASRLDYVCTTSALAARFSAAGNLIFTQDEINNMGFVYYSGDDSGVMSSGETSATTNASDHRPVVFDLLLGRTCPDTNGDNVVNFADLNAVLNQFGTRGWNLSGDFNGDGNVNFADLNQVLTGIGTSCS